MAKRYKRRLNYKVEGYNRTIGLIDKWGSQLKAYDNNFQEANFSLDSFSNLVEVAPGIYDFQQLQFFGVRPALANTVANEYDNTDNPELVFSKYDWQLREEARKEYGYLIWQQSQASKFRYISFDAGDIEDKSSINPPNVQDIPGATQKLPPVFTLDYKIQSFFVRRPEVDPFGRFSDIFKTKFVPSMYSVVEQSLKTQISQPPGRYYINTNSGNDVVVFYDAAGYNTFLNGCTNIANGNLKAISNFNERYAYLSSRGLLNNHEEAVYSLLKNSKTSDVFPFYSLIDFSTETDALGSFSFSNYLYTEELNPFFQKFLNLYVDLSTNFNKYYQNGQPDWLLGDVNGLSRIFTEKLESLEGDVEETDGAGVSDFSTGIVIDVESLLKDPSFIKNTPSKSGACSFLTDKISSLLFEKQMKKAQTDVLKQGQVWYKSYSETICYKVIKTDVRGGKRQTWIVPNFPTLDRIKLFDTALRFDEQNFRYEITALKAVVGVKYRIDVPTKDGNWSALSNIGDLDSGDTTKYIYESYSNTNTAGPTVSFAVYAKPDFKFIEVPYVTKDDLRVYDSAPSKPNMSFYAYKQVDNRITAVFNETYYKYISKKQNILTEDEAKNIKAEEYSRQRNLFKLGDMVYKGEPQDTQYYELFVLESAPKKYEDFAAGERIRILNPRTSQERTLAQENEIPFGNTYSLQLQPNKNYWVTARVEDTNGNISDPTPIFQIKIENTDGYINPTIKHFSMEESLLPKEVSTTPSFEKTVYIRPSDLHLPFGFEEFIGQSPVLAFENGLTSPFNKTYKLRIKSKKTNKKIDLNIFFDKQVKYITSEEDLDQGLTYESIEFEEVPEAEEFGEP